MGILPQKRLGRHDHAGRAEAALDRDLFYKGALDRIQLPALRQSFDRKNMAALQLCGKGQAGVNRLSVHDDGAGTAFTFRAPLFYAGEVQLISEDIVMTFLSLQELSKCCPGRAAVHRAAWIRRAALRR